MLIEKSLHLVQAMEKTLDLLYVLSEGREGLTVVDIAEELSLDRRDVLHLLVILEARGLVVWDQQARLYRPGTSAPNLAEVLAPPRTSPLPLPAANGRTAALSRSQKAPLCAERGAKLRARA